MKQQALIWDWPVRAGHWLLVAAFAIAWLTGDSETWRQVHVLAGGTVAGVISFRVLWGIIGTRYARFGDFVRRPAHVAAYLASLASPRPRHATGHNPAGGWAIMALLVLGLAAGASGWAIYQDIGGEWLEELHEGITAIMLALVGLHVTGVIIGSRVHRENLVRAMVTGRKAAPADAAIGSARAWVVLVQLAWVGAIAWWLSR